MCSETHWAAEDVLAGDAKARDWLAKWLLGLEWCGGAYAKMDKTVDLLLDTRM